MRRQLPILPGSWLLISTAMAEEGAKGAALGLPASPLSSGLLLETAGGLLLILALILGLGWLLRRYGRLSQLGKGTVTIQGGVSLGPRERAVLLQVEGTRLLVGVAPGRVQTLHVLHATQQDGEDEPFSGQLEEQLGEQSG